MSVPATNLPLKKIDVCERLQISARTLEGLVKKGSFPPAVRMGKHIYWSEKCVSDFVTRKFATQNGWRPS
jgi:predicted DNA-binding transcriptional regulator AlpA